MRNIDALIMLFASSFDVSRGKSCICLYTANKASSRYDHVLEYAFDTWNYDFTVQSYQNNPKIWKRQAGNSVETDQTTHQQVGKRTF